MPAIHVDDVWKKYNRRFTGSAWYALEDLARRMLARPAQSTELLPGDFWAVQNANFTIERGESVGIIGNNGAGKSTLLKLMMRRLTPTRGRVTTEGKIAAITELGLGFNPLLSGRENVYFNSALLGLPRSRTAELFDSIVAFADLAEFIDSPVQSYSTGMRARLGYAVAAHLQPDILLIDEVFAVGDLSFRRRCRQHLKTFHEQRGTLILVAHDMQAIQTLCERAIVIHHGRLVFDGPATDAIHFYVELSAELDHAELTGAAAPEVPSTSADARQTAPAPLDSTQWESAAEVPGDEPVPQPETADEPITRGGEAIYFGDLENDPATRPNPQPDSEPAADLVGAVARCAAADPEGVPDAEPLERAEVKTALATAAVAIRSVGIEAASGGELRYGEPARVFVVFEVFEPLEAIVCGFTLCTADLSTHIATVLTGIDDRTLSVGPGRHVWRGTIDRLSLRAGRYAMKVGLGEAATGAALADVGWESRPHFFQVTEPPSQSGNIRTWIRDLVGMDCEWEMS